MNDVYCSSIDSGLFVYATGEVKTCCAGSESLGDINQETIQNIFNKKRYIEIKNNLRSNKKDSYCSTCYALEEINPTLSQKYGFNQLYPLQEKQNLKLIDIRWSNICNLACRYCNTNDSSSWRKLTNIPIENVNKKYEETIFDLISENKKTISNVYLLGGEPLLQKQNEKLLELIDTDTQIDIFTNLSVKLDNNIIYHKLRTFKNINWNISFDNVGNKFEYVRAGADWKVFENNLNKLKEDKKILTFRPLYCIWSAFDLKAYYEFSNRYDSNILWQLALPRKDQFRTDSFCVPGHKLELVEKAIKEINSLNTHVDSLVNIKKTLEETNEIPEKDKYFLAWTEKIENIMSTEHRFKNLWPEIYHILVTN